jgi:undecaprenyl-diphosphatase
MFESLEVLDRSMLLWVNSLHHPVLDVIMWYFSKTWMTVLVVIIFAFAALRTRGIKNAVLILIGCAVFSGIADLSTNLIKHGVKRYRPTHNLEIKNKLHVVHDYYGGQYGFYSGHAANTFTVATFIILSLAWLNRIYKVLLLLYTVTVVYSRMYLGVHYPSDVLAGSIYGILVGWMGYQVMHRFFKEDEKIPV